MSSMIYMITTTSASVSQGELIPWQTIGRRITPTIENTYTSIILNCPGYYKVTGTVSFTAPTTGDVTIALRKAGVNVPGIKTCATVATADTETHTVPYTGIIRILPSEVGTSIDLINSGIGIDVANATLVVESLK